MTVTVTVTHDFWQTKANEEVFEGRINTKKSHSNNKLEWLDGQGTKLTDYW
ncbi:hypothetical protein KT99_08483 [Shewanella benthica KT99]|uniref:Uncharacterized protein n=1 Tax=Shewanella benthica KT99 TaxID=314608 RepID=A9D123_9GAMM|nr:hypothetical protein KT99_08483 [Shewanella benthica KT99]